MPRARRIAGFLQVHAEVDEVHDDLHVTLRLHAAAHDAERQPGLAVLGDEGGNDGVERPLARRVDVGVAVLEREQLAAILQDEAAAVGRHARAHAAVVALDQRDHVAGRIRHRHVDGVALIEGLGVGGIFERGPIQA